MSIKQQTVVALVGEPSDYMIRDTAMSVNELRLTFLSKIFFEKYILYFLMVGATENDGQQKPFLL
jgi:hypothetical protein